MNILKKSKNNLTNQKKYLKSDVISDSIIGSKLKIPIYTSFGSITWARIKKIKRSNERISLG